MLADEDDPLAAATKSMRGPDEAPAVLSAEAARELLAEDDARRAEQDASLGPAAPMERRFVTRRPDGSVSFVAGLDSTEADVLVAEGETLRHELVPAGVPAAWVAHSRTPFNEWVGEGGGDPGDEQPETGDEPGGVARDVARWDGPAGDDDDEQPEPPHVETRRVVVVRDDEGEVVRFADPAGMIELALLDPGQSVAVETWPIASILDLVTAGHPTAEGLAEILELDRFEAGLRDAPDARPTVYAPYGTLDDDALQKLEELGIDVQEVSDDAEPEPKAQGYSELGLLNETAVRDVDETGTVRELRILPGGAVDLAPRRKVQVWIDLRFQYESEHQYGADDMLEEARIRRFGKLVEQFATLAVENGEAEGMAIPTVTAHVLDKPDDPT